jgi:hypothetical protein
MTLRILHQSSSQPHCELAEGSAPETRGCLGAGCRYQRRRALLAVFRPRFVGPTWRAQVQLAGEDARPHGMSVRVARWPSCHGFTARPKRSVPLVSERSNVVAGQDHIARRPHP